MPKAFINVYNPLQSYTSALRAPYIYLKISHVKTNCKLQPSKSGFEKRIGRGRSDQRAE
jgi:hypothetical protein